MFDILHRIQDHLRRGFKDLLPSTGFPMVEREPEDEPPQGMVWGVAPHQGINVSPAPAVDPGPVEDLAARSDDHQRFTFIRSILEKSGFDAEGIAKVQKSYNEVVPKQRTWISELNEVAGWRRVATIGIGTKAWHVMGVTETGLFVTADIYCQDDEPIDHPREAVRQIREGRIQGVSFTGRDEFNFNIHSNAFHGYWAPFANARQSAFGAAVRFEGSKDVGTPARAKLKGMARHHARTRGRMITRMLWASLDPDVRFRMRSSLTMSATHARWFAGGGEVNSSGNGFPIRAPEMNWRVDPTVGLARRQAAAAFPILTDWLLNNDVLAEAIDARKPLVPVLANELAASPDVIRALQGLTWQKAGCSPASIPLKNWLELPAAQVPKNRAEFRAYARMMEYAKTAGMDADDLRKRAKGRFSDVMHQLGRVDPASLSDHLEDAFQRLVLPKILMDRPDLRHALVADVERGWVTSLNWTARKMLREFSGYCLAESSPKDIVEANIGWHRNLGSIDRDLGVDVKGENWDALLNRKSTAAGITLREIDSLPGLRRQGRVQHHCVGTYGAAVTRWSGGPGEITLIYSLEREAQILSTAELRIQVDYPRDKETKEITGPVEVKNVRMIQNRASHNGKPPAETTGAIEEIKRDLLALTPEALEAYAQGMQGWATKPRDESISRLSELLNADLENPDYLEKAWARLAPVLPKSLRRAGLDGLLSADPVRGLIENLDAELQQAAKRKPWKGRAQAQVAAQEAGAAQVVEEDDPLPF